MYEFNAHAHLVRAFATAQFPETISQLSLQLDVHFVFTVRRYGPCHVPRILRRILQVRLCYFKCIIARLFTRRLDLQAGITYTHVSRLARNSRELYLP